MSYIDNSGDIILDAVLTDLGRARIAAGKFNIAKFALGDEEINYKLWNPNHPQGSNFYDLEIMQTPILEAFTSDQSLMKTKLLTYESDSLVYMPTLDTTLHTNGLMVLPIMEPMNFLLEQI